MSEKHPVSALQEMMMQSCKKLPVYDVRICGNASFECTVHVDGVEAIGQGSSKAMAKHVAAKEALLKLGHKNDGVSSPAPLALSISSALQDKNFVGLLNELAAKKRADMPVYLAEGKNNENEFVITCSVLGQLAKGSATTKKQAKQNAAESMLTLMKESVDEEKLSSPSKAVEQRKPISDDEVIKKFQELSFEAKIWSKETLGSVCDVVPRFPLDTVPLTVPEMYKELSNMNLKVNVEVIQKQPVFILALHLGQYTFLEADQTYEVALETALARAIRSLTDLKSVSKCVNKPEPDLLDGCI